MPDTNNQKTQNAQHDLIMNKLDNLSDDFNQHQRQTQEVLKRHSETLYGNGRKGITTTVELLELNMENVLETQKATKAWLVKVITPIITAGLLSLLYMAFGGTISGG